MQRGIMAAKERLAINLEANDDREVQRIAQQNSVTSVSFGRRTIKQLLVQNKSQRGLPFSLPYTSQLEP